MLQGAYLQASNKMLEDNKKYVPGEFNSYGARKMGLNLNTNNIRYKKNIDTDTYEKKSKIKKEIAIAGAVAGGALLVAKRKDISKLLNRLREKMSGSNGIFKKIFKKSSEESVQEVNKKKFGQKISDFFAKFKKTPGN